jgi:hypothetical protein
VTSAIEEVYAASLPWVREQASTEAPDQETNSRAPDTVKPLVAAVEASAAIVEGSSGPSITEGELGDFLDERDSLSNGGGSESFEQLVAAVKELQAVV